MSVIESMEVGRLLGKSEGWRGVLGRRQNPDRHGNPGTCRGKKEREEESRRTF